MLGQLVYHDCVTSRRGREAAARLMWSECAVYRTNAAAAPPPRRRGGLPSSEEHLPEKVAQGTAQRVGLIDPAVVNLLGQEWLCSAWGRVR